MNCVALRAEDIFDHTEPQARAWGYHLPPSGLKRSHSPPG